jgi:protein-tyrosine-phosphatase
MAMAIFQSRVAREPGSWLVESAGTWAPEGAPASVISQMVLAERGLDLSNHRSRRVSREIINSFDLVLTMEDGHKEALQIEFPEMAERIYLLSEMIGLKYNIADPMGGIDDDFRSTANEITQILTDGYEKILQLASVNP